MKKYNPLQSLGLSLDEILVYECLLEHVALSPTELGTLTTLYRPVIYASLQGLLSRNLVVETPFGKRKKYVATSPKQLKHLLSAQEKLITEEIIRLEDLPRVEKNIPKVIVLQGKLAIRTIYDQIMQDLKKGDIYYRYQSVDNDTLASGGYMSERARSLRNVKGLERFVITNKVNKSKIRAHPNRYVKVLPDKYALFEHGVGQIIYGNKTAIIDYNNETATIIESDSIAAFQKSVFNSLFSYI